MNIVIVGQGAMGLLWHYHLNTLKNINHNTIQSLSLLPSKSASKAASKSAPKKTCAQEDHNKSKHLPYYFTHFNGTTEQCTYQVTQAVHLNNADIILLCVKAYQVAKVLKEISPQIKNNSIIILAHNGMGTLATISEQFLAQHYFLALLTTHGCTRVTVNHVIHTGVGHSDIGKITGQLSQSKIQQISQLLQQALPISQWQENISNQQWQKLAVNCVINPLTALHNIVNGEINSLKFNEIKKQLLTEIITVASAENIHLNFAELLDKVEQVAEKTAKNCSSMRADILAKRQTEIDHINGYIHNLGVKHKIATPKNSWLWQQIKQME